MLGSAVGGVDLGLRTLGGHIAVDSATAMVAVLAAHLVFARFVRDLRVCELLLVAALVTVAVSALAFGAIPAAAHASPTRFRTWSNASASLLGGLLFAVAALGGTRRIAHPRRAVAWMCVLVVVAFALIAIGFGLAAQHLPLGINPSLSPNATGHPRVVGNSVLLAMTAATALALAAAAIGFARRSTLEHDELIGWFSVSATLSAIAGLNFFLFPSRYSHWIFVGDWLRLAAYLMLLVAAAREIAAYQRGIAAAAVLEERRRLARELHDGLAQELAFISTQSRRLLSHPGDSQRVDQLAQAAERALDESRSAIRALTRRLDDPLETALGQAAEEVADRVGITVLLDLEAGIEVPARTREALLRIVREAVSNTARHSHASKVHVTLARTDRIRLRIVDDGVGFDTDADDGFGFGLVSMRERAHALGGSLQVMSRPGEGTHIDVVIP